MYKHTPLYHWGSPLWAFIHTVTIVDTEQNQKIVQILKNIHDVIPCPNCQVMYNTFLNKLNLMDLREPMCLFYWSIDLHNSVNQKLGYPIWSYSNAVKRWSQD